MCCSIVCWLAGSDGGSELWRRHLFEGPAIHPAHSNRGSESNSLCRQGESLLCFWLGGADQSLATCLCEVIGFLVTMWCLFKMFLTVRNHGRKTRLASPVIAQPRGEETRREEKQSWAEGGEIISLLLAFGSSYTLHCVLDICAPWTFRV